MTFSKEKRTRAAGRGIVPAGRWNRTAEGRFAGVPPTTEHSPRPGRECRAQGEGARAVGWYRGPFVKSAGGYLTNRVTVSMVTGVESFNQGENVSLEVKPRNSITPYILDVYDASAPEGTARVVARQDTRDGYIWRCEGLEVRKPSMREIREALAARV